MLVAVPEMERMANLRRFPEFRVTLKMRDGTGYERTVNEPSPAAAVGRTWLLLAAERDVAIGDVTTVWCSPVDVGDVTGVPI